MGKQVKCIHRRIYDGDFCLECGAKATDMHHCVYGKNRANSEQWGLTIMLCRSCHSRLHDKDEKLAMKYRQMAQIAFEYEYGHEKWMEIFGRSYV